MAFTTILRFNSRNFLRVQYSYQKLANTFKKPLTTIPAQQDLEREGESHDERNVRLNRPMSPHLTIYKVQLTTVLSISHRITGCAMSAYLIAMAGAAACPYDFNSICASIEAINPGNFVILTGKFMIAFPFMYHTCNGVRHLLWDTGRQLNKNAVVTTGTAVLAASIITTLVVMFL